MDKILSIGDGVRTPFVRKAMECVGWLTVSYMSCSLLRNMIPAATDNSVSYDNKSGKSPLKVVITGSSRGIGLALCRSFLRKNDHVVVSGRSQVSVDAALKTLREEFPDGTIVGQIADVCNQASITALATFAQEQLGGIDVFICNAGKASTHAPLTGLSEDEIRSVLDTNLLGTMLSYKAAMTVMSEAKRGHIFIMEGAGSTGHATPNMIPYGASKAGFQQLLKSLCKEAKEHGVGVHILQPGMVITDLLMGDSRNYEEKRRKSVYKIFNILAEAPHTVGEYLVPRIRAISRSKKSGSATRYLTIPSVIWRFVTSPFRHNRLIDVETGALKSFKQ